MAEKLSRLETDLYDASTTFAEKLNNVFKGATYQSIMRTIPGVDVRRTITIDNLGGSNSTGHRYHLVYMDGLLSFPEADNSDTKYMDYIKNRFIGIDELIR